MSSDPGGRPDSVWTPSNLAMLRRGHAACSVIGFCSTCAWLRVVRALEGERDRLQMEFDDATTRVTTLEDDVLRVLDQYQQEVQTRPVYKDWSYDRVNEFVTRLKTDVRALLAPGAEG